MFKRKIEKDFLSALIEKELKNDKKKYRIKFMNSVRFIASSLSSFLDNLPVGLHNSECNYCKSFLEFVKTKDELLIFKC